MAQDLPALHERVVQVEPRSATDAELQRVHSPEYMAALRAGVERARAEGSHVILDPVREADTILSSATWAASAGSAGAAIEACEGVTAGRFRNAFAACRPPGHHATADRAMGFCFFNAIAVATRWLQDNGHARRVLIVDWDVHHGNGTQDIFYADPTVFVLNLHQSPHYPGTGRADERGEGSGVGATLNVPLEAGLSRDAYLEAYTTALDQALGVFEPDFILVSCGFDILAGDPLGGQRLEVEDIHRMTREIMARAENACEGRLVLLLEGGYDAKRTGAGAVNVLRALSGLEAEGSTV